MSTPFAGPSLDDRARHKQIREAADELLAAVESKPTPEAAIASRAIRAAVKFVTKDYKTAAMFFAVEG